MTFRLLDFSESRSIGLDYKKLQKIESKFSNVYPRIKINQQLKEIFIPGMENLFVTWLVSSDNFNIEEMPKRKVKPIF